MRNRSLGAKCLLLGMLVVLLGAIYSRHGAAASRTPRQSPHLGGQYAAQGAAVRATLTPEPTAGPQRPSLCERRPQGLPALPECQDRSADIYLRLSADPGGTVAPASVMTYQLAAYNSGRGDAADVRIRLPLAPNVQTPLDAAFGDSSAWVSAVLTDAIELRFPALKRDQMITATVWLRISPAAPLGRDLTTRARLSWSGHDDSARLSNLAPLVIARASAAQRPAALAIDPAAGTPATIFSVAYHGFASNEHVSLWYHRDDGGAVGLGEVRADAQGHIDLRVSASALGVGRYTVIAAGQYSQVSAVGSLSVSDDTTNDERRTTTHYVLLLRFLVLGSRFSVHRQVRAYPSETALHDRDLIGIDACHRAGLEDCAALHQPGDQPPPLGCERDQRKAVILRVNPA